MLAFAVQFGGERFDPGPGSLVEPLVLVVAAACAGALLLPVMGFAVTRIRRTVHAWRAERRRLRAAATAERRARALMSELCRHGWRAQITLGEGDGTPAADDDSGAPGRGVALDWTELGDDAGRPAVMRRVWAPTIGEALEAMVADRQTDETLEQIELRASADGALWPDP